MRLGSIQLYGMGALSDVRVSFGGDAPRPLTVLFGGDGVGKTSLLAAIGCTRPGHAIPILPRRPRIAEDEPRDAPFAVADWMLGDDDPDRPHALRVASPNAQLGEPEGEAMLRRREQALFDKRAQERGGHAFASISGARWFSRAPIVLASPERSVLRYDPRAALTFDDATRADLTRDVKQTLAFAGIGAALEAEDAADLTALDEALREAAATTLAPFHAEYTGIHPKTLEPLFEVQGRAVVFEDLPRGARHLLAIATTAVRTLATANAASDRPIREREGVIAVDDIESQQDGAILRHVPALLKAMLPRAQWLVATSAPAVTLGCDRGEVVALRRDPEATRVVVHEDASAVLH